MMAGNVVIVDYGMGNHTSIQKRLNHLGCICKISSSPADIKNADKLILPGVGHFGPAMKNIKSSGVENELNNAVLHQRKPVLGICLGMQLMTSFSEEGQCDGLNWLDARVTKLVVRDTVRYKIPHAGWNSLHIKKQPQLLFDIDTDKLFYFVHSYRVICSNISDIVSTTTYESEFHSAFEHDNLFGVQFHPEKSHDQGLKLLSNFINL